MTGMNGRDEHMNGPGCRSRDERTTMIVNKGRSAGEGFGGRKGGGGNGNIALGAGGSYQGCRKRIGRKERDG